MVCGQGVPSVDEMAGGCCYLKSMQHRSDYNYSRIGQGDSGHCNLAAVVFWEPAIQKSAAELRLILDIRQQKFCTNQAFAASTSCCEVDPAGTS
jgi:hypothetical protein